MNSNRYSIPVVTPRTTSTAVPTRTRARASLVQLEAARDSTDSLGPTSCLTKSKHTHTYSRYRSLLASNTNRFDELGILLSFSLERFVRASSRARKDLRRERDVSARSLLVDEAKASWYSAATHWTHS